MDHRRLVALLRDVPRPLAMRVQDYLVALGHDQLSAVRGLETRLAIIAESHTGAYLEPGGPGTIDLQAALRDREVVLLKFHGQLSNSELAKALDVSESNAGTRLHRALTRLREQCDGLEREERIA